MRNGRDLDIGQFGSQADEDALVDLCAQRGLALDINGIAGTIKVGRRVFRSYAAALEALRASK